MEKINKQEWHDWFCWYPVYSIEYGWVWLRDLMRKKIPAYYTDPALNKSRSAMLSEKLTGCWHRIPDYLP